MQHPAFSGAGIDRTIHIDVGLNARGKVADRLPYYYTDRCPTCQ
jgi:hypothetical protein